MKVSILTPSVSRLGGGLYGCVRQLAVEICKKHNNTKVYSLADKYSKIDQKSWLPIVPQVSTITGPQNFGYSRDLIDSIRQGKPDILHQHGLWMYPSIVSSFLAKEGLKTIISPHGMLDEWALNNSRLKKRLALKLFERTNLSRARCIHALCEEEYRSIKALGIEKPVCIVPNGVMLPEKKSPSPVWGKRFQQKKILLYLGRIHPKKGLSILIDAWSQCSVGIKKNWVLVIVGWSQLGHEKELRKQANTLGIKNDVIFLGPQHDGEKHACYENADAFILPSYSEGLPMVILEAWSHGLPVLMTPQCNLPIGYSDGGALRIMPETKSVIKGLETIMTSTSEERLARGALGYNLVKEDFLWSKVAKEMMLVYEWVIKGTEPPECIRFD